MRRKDREITDFDEMMKIIAKCDTCRLVLFDDEFPYIVPLNFGTDVEEGQLYLYFHSAKVGTKLDLIRKNNKVTFEMDCEHNIIMYDERMSCTMGYESVIGHGHEEDFKFNEKVAMMTEVFRVKVLDMTGKRRDNIHPEEKVKRHITLE